MSGGGERITVASLLAGEGAQVVKSEDGQVKSIPSNHLLLVHGVNIYNSMLVQIFLFRCKSMCIRARMRRIEEGVCTRADCLNF